MGAGAHVAVRCARPLPGHGDDPLAAPGGGGAGASGGAVMDFYAVLDQVLDLLRQRGRVTYRALKRQFELDDDVLEDLKEEIIEAHRLAIDEEGKVLVWTGDAAPVPPPAAVPAPPPERPPLAYTPTHL